MKKLLLALALCFVMVSLLAIPAIAAPAKAAPKILFFATFVTSDGIKLPGCLPGGVIIKTDGVPGTMHTLGLADTKAKPDLADGNYAFTLKAGPAQQAALSSYFAAKVGWPPAYLAQIAAEINGTSPFFYLNASSGVYSLVDNFKKTLGISPATLTIDDDYPVGTYFYKGTLKGTNGATLDLIVTLRVVRPPKILFFATFVTSDGIKLPGCLPGGIIIKTDGVPGTMHTLGLTDTKAKPDLADGNYAFTLKAGPAQQAALSSYFAAKGWPPAYLAQIAAEINGTSPFFYLKASSGTYSLADGFKYALGDTNAPLLIDDDYPVGTYFYKGTLKGTNGATLDLIVTLKVVRPPRNSGRH